MARYFLTLRKIVLYTSDQVVAEAAMRHGWRKIGVREYSRIKRENNNKLTIRSAKTGPLKKPKKGA